MTVVTTPSITTLVAIWGPLQPTAERSANSVRRSITDISIVFITPMPPISERQHGDHERRLGEQLGVDARARRLPAPSAITVMPGKRWAMHPVERPPGACRRRASTAIVVISPWRPLIAWAVASGMNAPVSWKATPMW